MRFSRFNPDPLRAHLVETRARYHRPPLAPGEVRGGLHRDPRVASTTWSRACVGGRLASASCPRRTRARPPIAVAKEPRLPTSSTGPATTPASFLAAVRELALEGDEVLLRPLTLEDAAFLWVGDPGARGTFGFTSVPASLEESIAATSELLAGRDRGDVVPFATVAKTTGDVVGTTRYLTIRFLRGRPVPDAVEIGGTWL